MRVIHVFCIVALSALPGILSAQTTLEECRYPGLTFGGANGTPTSIADVITLDQNLVIADTQIDIEIAHTYVADIVLDLTSPQGTTLRLHDGAGGNADDLWLTYDDDGVPNGSLPYDCSCIMQAATGSLAVFATENSLGNWSLGILDDFPSSDDGTLVSWCVRVSDSDLGTAPPVQDLACLVTSDGADLSWTNPVLYDSIVVTVDGVPTLLPGTATDFTLSGLPSGVAVEATVEGTLSGAWIASPAQCTVVPFGSPVALTEKLVLVLIDGLRYSEGLGDPAHVHVPNMAAIAAQGTLIEPFSNTGSTVTTRGVPAVMCGSYQDPTSFFDPDCQENNQASPVPYIHEYYRRQLGRPPEDSPYVLGPYCPWRGSFHPAYGPDYWPQWIATSGGDDANWAVAQTLLATTSPSFLTLYLPDVDSAGHSGDWPAYLAAIENADAIVGALWTWLQQDPDYSGVTTMIVTNDHGRHDYDFQGHGDGCIGCRTIQLLAVGPAIKSGYVSTVPRSQPDIAPTIGALLGVQTEYADGEVMTEILEAQTFVRGDTNQDGTVGIADVITGLDALFAGTPTTCHDSHDANDDGANDVSDPVFMIGYLFGGTAQPAIPFPQCGVDPTFDGTDCASFVGCP